MFNWKPIISFVVTLIRPTLDILIYFKTKIEQNQDVWFLYYTSLISKKINIWIHGKSEEPCWEMDKIYKVYRGKHPDVYIKKTGVGFLVWSLTNFFHLDIYTREIIKPCFISILYVSETGVEFDIELGPEFYICGNQLLSFGFVKWWIKTRYGVFWNNYSPNDPYKIVLIDKQLNTIELGPKDFIILNKRGYSDGRQYKKCTSLLDIDELEEE